MICENSIMECNIAGLETNKYFYEVSLINTGFTDTTQTTEVLIYFTSPTIYVVDTAFLELSNTNYTQLAITTKTFDNGTNYYSALIQQNLAENTTYSFVIIIKKNPNNDAASNLASFPQKLIIWISNYYTNNFIPYSGLIIDMNFDLQNMNNLVESDFTARYASYVILIVFCFIAFGFLVAFIIFNVYELKKKKNKIAFQPLAKTKPEDEHNEPPKELMQIRHNE